MPFLNQDFSARQPFQSFDEAVGATLDYLQQLLDFDCWLLSRIDGEQAEIIQCKGDCPGVSEGERFDWADSICARMIAGTGPVIAPDLLAVEGCQPLTLLGQLSLRAYIGMPLFKLDGSLYGILCGFDQRVKPDSIRTIKPVLECVGRLLSTLVSSDLRTQEQVELTGRAQQAEEQLKLYAGQLVERIKELACLYEIDQLGRDDELSIEQLLLRVAQLLPPGWQHPELTEVQISFEGQVYATEQYQQTIYSQSAPLQVNKRQVGSITVCYRECPPGRAEDPFLEEEHSLINSTAARLSGIIQRKRAELQLQEERWRLQSIIEGTHVGTWEWNVQTGETVFNERWAEMIGYSLAELEPVSIETWMRFANEEDLAGSERLLEQHFSGELAFYDIECRMRHREGHWVWVHDRGKVFSWDEAGKPLMMFGTHQDITERKAQESALREAQQRFEQLSKHDGLTGLLNRRGWNECIRTEERRAKRYGHHTCVVMVDLDGLKTVNDQQGHNAGDMLICRAARCLQEAVRDVDQVARIGGDEFAILAVECSDDHQQTLLLRLESILAEQGIGASWGIAHCELSDELSDTVAEADRRMYEMKAQHHAEQGRGK